MARMSVDSFWPYASYALNRYATSAAKFSNCPPGAVGLGISYPVDIENQQSGSSCFDGEADFVGD